MGGQVTRGAPHGKGQGGQEPEMAGWGARVEGEGSRHGWGVGVWGGRIWRGEAGGAVTSFLLSIRGCILAAGSPLSGVTPVGFGMDAGLSWLLLG